MKLVGASNWFVRGPFMLEGLFTGFAGCAARGHPAPARQGDRAARDPRPRRRRLRRAGARVRLDRADPARARAAARSRRLRADATPLPARLVLQHANTCNEQRSGQPAERVREAGGVEELELQRIDELARHDRHLEGTGQERARAPSASTWPPDRANARPNRNAIAPPRPPARTVHRASSPSVLQRASARYRCGCDRLRRGRGLPAGPNARRRAVFTPGVPIPLDKHGLGDLGAGDLAVVRKQRGRARLERSLGPADRIENVLEGAARARGAAPRVRAVRPAGAEPRGTRRPARAADVHDRPGDREGLRRRDLDASRGRRDPRLGAHRRRVVVRARGLAARPRRRRARAVRLRPGLRRADAPARARRRRLLASPERRPALRHGRDAVRRLARGRRADVLPLGDPLERAADVRAGASRSSRARARAPRTSPRACGSPRRSRSSSGAAGSRAARCGSPARRSRSRSTATAASRRRGSSPSRTRTR